VAYKFQLADAKASTLKNIAGVCPSSQAFVDLVNEAQRRLLKRGNWFGTEWLVQLCVQSCVITWPRYVGTVLGVRFCSGVPAELFNHWFSFIGPHASHRGWHSDITIQDLNPAPCFSDISGTTGKLVRYHVVKNNDVGKKITLYGKQYGAQPLQEKVSGIWVDGVTLTAASPFVSTSQMVTKITSITREATEGMAYLYEYDPVTNVLRDLSVFEPNETNPQYRRSHCIGFPRITHTCDNDPNELRYRRVEALVKLAFIPLKNDRDFLIIDDFDALKLACQSIKAEEGNNDSVAEAKMLKAVRELNFADRDAMPDNQTPVRVIAVDGRRITNPM
jgi:hypothetical protein